MCGRYAVTVDSDAIQQAFGLESVVDFAPRYNIAPTQYAPIITNEHPRALSLYKWGLVPSWAKEAAIGNKMINARADGIAEKPSYRSAFKRRRCLVPVTGFYSGRRATARPRRRCTFR